MRLGIRFFLSWIVSALIMFALFYLWHGKFLNDFKRIQFPIAYFVTFAAFTYMVLGAGIYFLFESRLMKRVGHLFLRAVVTGFIAGLSVFMIATIVNISLTSRLSVHHLLIDCSWQILEQVVGGMVVLLFKIFIHDPIQEMA
jgi:hypothetical protein